jgi:enoyl-CoA hydratase/carnithine racemase
VIRTTLNGAVVEVAFARPEKKNALTPAMLDEFCRAVESIDPEAKAVVVAGDGDAFCSGFDLSLCRENSDALAELLKGLASAILALRKLPQPVVMAVQGAAIAGGCALLGGADVVVTHREAKLGYPVVKLGISPAVSMPFLMPAVGAGAARARALDTSLISGTEAARIGLAHECRETAGEVLPRARAIAQEIAAKPAVGVRASKAWLNELDRTLEHPHALSGLKTSLSLVGSEEERSRLAELWKK